MTENQRKWAIEEIEANILPDACDEVAERALVYAIEALSQPERPKGRWVFEPHPITHNWLYRCTSCNGWEEDTPPFCPNCGADMVRGEEE